MLVRVFLTLFLFTGCASAIQISAEPALDKPLAVLVPGSGTYSREISTDNAQAQAFF